MTTGMRDDVLVPLEDQMRKRLRKAAQMQSKWRDERDDLIREASANGASLREIAAIVDLSSTGVLKILRKEPDLNDIEADIIMVVETKTTKRARGDRSV